MVVKMVMVIIISIMVMMMVTTMAMMMMVVMKMTMVMLMMMLMMIDDYEDEEDNLTTIPLQRLERQPDERDKCRQTGTCCKWAKGGFFQMLPTFKFPHMMGLITIFKLG